MFSISVLREWYWVDVMSQDSLPSSSRTAYGAVTVVEEISEAQFPLFDNCDSRQ